MREYSLEWLRNDTEEVVGTLFGSDSDDGSDTSDTETPQPTTATPSVTSETESETPETKATTDDSDSTETDTETRQPTTKAPESTTKMPTSQTNDESSSTSATTGKSDTNAESASEDHSYSWDHSGSNGVATPDATASPFTLLPPTKTPTSTLAPTSTPTATVNTSAHESTQQIATSSTSNSLPGGAIAGVVVAAVCVMLMVAAFVTRKKRKLSQRQRFSESKVACLGDSQVVVLASTRLEPPGNFGKFKGSWNEKEDPDMGGFFAISHDDPFTRQHMRKGGIWDDPVLVAARIPLEKIRIEELLARGGFGQVFLATYNNQTVAVKTLLPETAKDMTEINALFAETKVMAKLEHPCIVSFIGIAWESLSTICCVIEYLPGGDLRALLNSFQNNHTRPRGFDHDKVKIAVDIAHGLTYLHSMEPNILHRDLKSRNVLLTSELNAKLTDFGVSRERSDDLMTNAVGTSLWMAPEVMVGNQYDCKADVFSFGVMLSELDTHIMPYSNVRNSSGRKPTEAAMLQMVAAGTLQVEFSRDCPLELLTLAHACISVDPKDRPTAADALYKLQLAFTSIEEQEVTL